jgi:RNA polymerase sigma-B factor
MASSAATAAVIGSGGAGTGYAKPDTTELFKLWQRDRDTQARELLIKRYMPLARSLASRYRRSSEPFDDLVQVANLGLVKAVDRFDIDRGHSFATFAVPTIFGELRRYFRDSGWSVHIPRGLQERTLQVDAAQERLTARSGRAPTVDELAVFLELSTEEVLEALQASNAYSSVSLDTPAPGADGDHASYADTHGREDPRYELLEADLTIRSAARRLPVRERQLLHLRFAKNLTQTQIAEQIGVSQMQVSRLLRRAVDHLHDLAEADDGSAGNGSACRST